MAKLRKMISLKKRAANRANAIKSTGPRSYLGKKQASLNAIKHGLTRPVDASPWGKHLEAISRLISAEGLSQSQAQDIAKKILDYERNLEHQRKTFLDAKENSPTYEIPEEASVDLWLAEELDKSSRKTPLFDEELDEEMAKFFRKTAEVKIRGARNEAIERLQSLDRYLRRSALQLAKAVRNEDF